MASDILDACLPSDKLSQEKDVCQTLWCRQDNKCVTRLEPAAEGTLCDRNM
ncbi:hypothetical protein AVEN_257471-1, partial [Araneus ventricosus]